VLDALWSDRLLGRRRIDVAEVEPGTVMLRGRVRGWEEVGRAIALAERTKGVKKVEERFEVIRPQARQGA
jgi:osmotically-inducible protein OsmY